MQSISKRGMVFLIIVLFMASFSAVHAQKKEAGKPNILVIWGDDIGITNISYNTDEGDIAAIRHGDWKIVYLENRGEAFEVWREPFIKLRLPLIFNLRRDPYERAQHNANGYNNWVWHHTYIIYYGTAVAMQFLTTFKDYPPSQTPGSWSFDQILENLRMMQETANR